MRLTTKGRYAVTAMLDLAIHFEQGPITLADISQRQRISLSYLEQLFSKLRKSGLVESSRGPGGGYKLSRPAEHVYVAQIISAVDDNGDAGRTGKGDLQDQDACLTHELWKDLSEQIYTFLAGIDLAQLVQRRMVKEATERQDIQQRQYAEVQPEGA